MAKKRTIVGENLTPTLLNELGAVDEFPRTPPDFRPDGNWTNNYGIWTCHGYREDGNQNVGILRIERMAGTSSASFQLKVHQEIEQTDGLVNIVDAEIQCVGSLLGCPEQWQISSRFIDAEGKPINQLRAEEKGSIRRGVMTVESGGHTLIKREEVPWLTCDWCIFESIQRMKIEEDAITPFDMLEGLTVKKENQRLYYRGLHPTRIGTQQMSLHQFSQTGSAILPTEYWLDERHRLLAAISMNKAYVLDK